MHLDPSSNSRRATPLRVALLLDTRAWAGTESYVLSLARALQALPADDRARGVRVWVATPRASALWKRARAASISTFAIGRRGEWDPSTVWLLARRLKRRELDIIHVHNGRTALWGALAVKLARRGACISTQHFIEPAHAGETGWKGRLKSAVHRQLESGVAHHIAISHAVANAFLGRSHLADDLVTVVHNGIEVPTKAPELAQMPPELCADVACIARLEEEKDIPTLVRALALLNARRPQSRRVRAVIAGEGQQRAALDALVKEENAGEFVFLAGWTPHAAAILRGAKVAVLPSVAEPFGLALLEAMAQSKPVVAVNAGGPPEIVVEGETGLLVPPRDPGALADALECLLDNPNRAAQMGETGFKRLSECFQSERMARETLAVYRSVGA